LTVMWMLRQRFRIEALKVAISFVSFSLALILATVSEPAVPEGTKDTLMQSVIRLLTVDRNIEKGVELARRAVELHPDNPYAHEWLAYGLAALRMFDEALTHYKMAVKLRGGLPRLSSAWLPPTTCDEAINLLDAPKVEVSLQYGENVFKAVFIATPCFPPLPIWRDPKFLEQYNQMLVLYRYADGGRWDAIAHIYFRTRTLSGVGGDWLDDAKSVSLAFALATGCSYLKANLLPVESPPISIWLSERGEPNIISDVGHIYWRGVKPKREFAQWFIEVAHEYGHHAFVALGPFEGEHERYCGGMMSERLNSLWLLEMIEGGKLNLPPEAEVNKLRGVLKAYVLEQFGKDMFSFLEWLRGRSKGQEVERMSMRTFLGMVELIERNYSSRVLVEIFNRCASEDVKSFLKSLNEVVKGALNEGLHMSLRCFFSAQSEEGKPSFVMNVSGSEGVSVTLPSVITVPVWMPSGSVDFELHASGCEDAKADVSIDGEGIAVIVHKDEGRLSVRFRVRSYREGWRVLSIRLLGRGTITVSQLHMRSLGREG